jgi:hypothetical protein
MSKSTTKVASAASAAAAMTTPAQLERLGGHLRKLRLLKSGERLEALLQHAAANDLPYAEFLEQVLGEEVAAKTSKNIAMRTAMARFPFVKPLETFDFDYQPSIDRVDRRVLLGGFVNAGDDMRQLIRSDARAPQDGRLRDSLASHRSATACPATTRAEAPTGR